MTPGEWASKVVGAIADIAFEEGYCAASQIQGDNDVPSTGDARRRLAQLLQQLRPVEDAGG